MQMKYLQADELLYGGHTYTKEKFSIWWYNYELQNKIFRRKRLSTGANFVHVYLEI